MRRRYAKPEPFKLKRQEPSKPIIRRCPSGEYEIMLDGVKLSGGYSSFEDAEESEIWKGASGKV